MGKISGKPAGAPYTERNNHPQGRSGGKVPTKSGPAVGNTKNPNPTKSGGIFRPLKSN